MRFRSALPASLALVALAACQDAREPVAVPLDGAHQSAQAARPDGTIPGRYIVVLRDGVADVAGMAQAMTTAHGGSVRFTYEHAIRGFAANLPDAAVLALQKNPNVAYIEQDQVFTTVATQNNATWGLDRIDQQALPLNTTYSYETTASNVNAYIIDTGILFSHTDFGSRVQSSCFDAFGGNCNDGNGHGTHVAGTVGGTAYGVAKGVKLYAVRVLDNGGSGTTAGVIAGVDWVTANHVKPAVANMSLGGGASTTLDDAVRNSIAAGVTYAVAAGNGDFIGRQQPACNYSPARVREALTVGATTNTDAKTSWSNYGECVDLFAPGASITSAWHTGNTATNTISGTSMASPHVAGVAALYLANNPGAAPAAVFKAVYDNTTKGIVTSSSTANNHLLYSLFGTTSPPPNQPPVAGFTYSCTGLTCSFTDTSTDPDGSIASRSWNFGDGTTSTATNPTKSYSAGGTYTVTLTVTDDGGLSSSASQNVTVSSGGGAGITLSGTGYKVKGVQHADLTWSGATSTSVDVFRDNQKVATTGNSGTYTDNIGNKGGGSYVYQICEAGTSTCSNNVTIQF